MPPELRELNVDYGLSDIVAVRISPDVPMTIVAHPDYLAAHGRPTKPQDLLVAKDLAVARLQAVMPDWCTTFPGFHANYPSQRASSRALQVVIDAIRHRAA
jgi:DNA-binding transcriptional LysR family regulator